MSNSIKWMSDEFPQKSSPASPSPRNNGRRRSVLSVLLQKLRLRLISSTMPINSPILLLFFLFTVLVLWSGGVSSEPNPIMAFPSDTTEGSYSLFPDEDLRTGKKLRFDDDRQDRARPFPAALTPQDYRARDYFRDRDRDRYTTTYPIMFEDRFHRPGDYGRGHDRERDTRVYSSSDPFRSGQRERGSRVYFEDDFGRDRDRFKYYAEDDRFPPPPPRRGYNYNEHPSLLHRPLSPLRPFHDVPVPGPSHSKLPVGATLGNINVNNRNRGGGNDVRIHVFDPASNSFGNPRNAGKHSFQEQEGPSPELFLNHEQYLEYHRKIALVREEEFRKMKTFGQANSGENVETEPKRVLFTAKQPYDISGLSPPQVDATTPDSGTGSNKVQNNPPVIPTPQNVPVAVYNGESPNKSDRNDRHQYHSKSKDETRTGNNNDEVKETNKKDVEEPSANGKSQVTQIPPTRLRPNFISKSGRKLAFEQIQRQIHNHNQRSNNTVTATVTTTSPTRVASHFSIFGSRTRQPLTSSGGFEEVLQAEGNSRGDGSKVKKDNDERISNDKVSTSTTAKSTSTTSTAATSTTTKAIQAINEISESAKGSTALSLIEIPIESDGVVRVGPDFPLPDPSYKKLYPTEESGQHFSKGSTSELGAETKQSKNRIKTNTASKVAIIKQQELKQIMKNETQKAKSTNTPRPSLSLNGRNASQTHANFQIPLFPVKNMRVGAMGNQFELQSNNDYDHYVAMNNERSKKQHPFLNNNDLVDAVDTEPQAKKDMKEEEQGHFILINANNHHIDIIEDAAQNPILTSSTILETDIDINNHYRRDTDSFVPQGRNTTKNVNDVLKNDTYYDLMPINSSTAASFIKVIRLKSPKASLAFSSANFAQLPTAGKTVSTLMVKKTDTSSWKKQVAKAQSVLLSSSINSAMLSHFKAKGLKSKKTDKFSVAKSPSQLQPAVVDRNGIEVKNEEQTGNETVITGAGGGEHMKMKMTMTSSASQGVIAKVHAHVSHCPKLKAPAEIICDIHIRDSHGHPNPQLTVGWRRKFYNSTQPDILLVSNKTQVYEEDEEVVDTNGNRTTIATPKHEDDGARESLEDFHDKFNVTLAPGISPMLRSVLLIRSITPPDCGNYQCEVSDGVYTLQSETLLFLCH